MTHIIRMTGRRVRIPPIENAARRPHRETAICPDVLQALCENQRLSRKIASAYRMPHRAGHLAASTRWVKADLPTIFCPSDVAMLLGEEMSTLIQEQLRILLLDSKNHVLGCEMIYQGTIHSISIRVAEVLRPAVLANALALIVVHNYPSGPPSGDPDPSPEDTKGTKTLMAAGKLLDIDVLDHVVLGCSGEYASLRERGLVRLHAQTAAA